MTYRLHLLFFLVLNVYILSTGYVHLWADRTNDQISFNHQTQDTVFPDEVFHFRLYPLTKVA